MPSEKAIPNRMSGLNRVKKRDPFPLKKGKAESQERSADRLKVLFVASEAVPYAKTGGLADMVTALGKALHRLGCDVRAVIPYYTEVRDGPHSIVPLIEEIPAGFQDESLPAEVLMTTEPAGFPVYFIRRDEFFDRSHLYTTSRGDYRDNGKRFLYFSKSVFSLCEALDFQPDILHCHDWQAALVPVYLRHVYRRDPFFRETAGILTIHNLAYQGIFPSSIFQETGLPGFLNTMEWMEFWGNISFLKGGIYSADLLNTVSPTYSREILEKKHGCGLEGVLADRRKDLHGVLNGVDYEVWDPAVDEFLPAKYSAETLDEKQVCKKALLKEFGINSGPTDMPLLGMISRLSEQKGIDVLAAGLEHLLAQKVAFVMLGEGEEQFRDLLLSLAKRFPRKMGVRLGYDNGLAHRMEAGCDIFVMPSRYEPCGLNQFYSMKYGTVPVVRATGGLQDSVEEFEPGNGKGTGFKFSLYSPEDFLAAAKRAISVYQEPAAWLRLQKNCMRQDFSWEESARKYLDLYKVAITKSKVHSLRI